ncbi:MAG: hypothetical protein FWC96_09590, partial [Oscillospiraceae bacterium]|nr:hypothetical protein [Oscillospiraceae bacterium]
MNRKIKKMFSLLIALLMVVTLIPTAIATVEDADHPLEDIVTEYPAEPGDYDYDDNNDDTYYVEDEYVHEYPEYEALGELNPVPGYIDIVAFSTPVSTAAELREAIALGGTQVIELANDIVDSLPSIHIPPGADITLTSGPGGPFSLVRAAPARHFVVNDGSTLTLENVTIDGGGSNSQGGGITVQNGGSLYLNYGGTITGNRFPIGGGVFIDVGGTFTMNDGL